ncbi:conserved protein, unknown function [Hepatocystis sp. ex Piliocolobus tephrosceles]|nr:conserved protein, unknown function [Hepatocystis sp. ex Piliocolobus tephrosceles]
MIRLNFLKNFVKTTLGKNGSRQFSNASCTKKKEIAKKTGGTMLLFSPILFEIKNKNEENSPKSEYIFMAGKSIDFLTQKIFENEMGTSILYLTFFIAYLALLVHDNRINLMVQKLKFKYSNNMFNIGHPNYKKFMRQNDMLKKE